MNKPVQKKVEGEIKTIQIPLGKRITQGFKDPIMPVIIQYPDFKPDGKISYSFYAERKSVIDIVTDLVHNYNILTIPNYTEKGFNTDKKDVEIYSWLLYPINTDNGEVDILEFSYAPKYYLTEI